MRRRWVFVRATLATSRRISLCLTLCYRRQPVPYRNVKCDAGRVAKISDAVGAVDRKLGRIDSVGVVEAEGRQVGAARSKHVGLALMKSRHGAAQLGIIFRGCLLDLRLRGQRRNRIGHGKHVCRARIGKQEYSQFESGFFSRQSGIGQLPLALLLLKLGLDDIGVGGFPLLFTLAGQRSKVGGFGPGALGDGKLVVGRK